MDSWSRNTAKKKNQTNISKMLLMVFGDIYIDDLHKLFPDASMNITKREKIIRKTIKKTFR